MANVENSKKRQINNLILVGGSIAVVGLESRYIPHSQTATVCQVHVLHGTQVLREKAW